MTTADLLAQLTSASSAEDIFGPVSDDPRAIRAAKKTFRTLAGQLHPDRATSIERAQATVAFARLSTLHDQWRARTTANGPASRAGSDAITLTSHRGSYRLGALLAKGTVANVYRATGSAGPVAVKIPRRPPSSRYLLAERSALDTLAELTADRDNAWLAPYYPRLVDRFTHRSPADAVQRSVNVQGDLSCAAGYVPLSTIATALPQGLDGKDWAWIYRRLLRAIAGAHMAGLVHGAILADNVLIHPQEHGVVLAGWSFATREGQRLAGRVRSAADDYPPEADDVVTAATDVYLAATLMLRMLAPGERRQRAFARGCLQTSPRMRPTAADLLLEYDELLENLYGPRRFRVFPYTNPAATTTA